MENQEEGKENEVPIKKNEEKKEEEKGRWTVNKEAVVYECNEFKLTYKWDDAFWNFISLLSLDTDENKLPAGYDRASNLVGFLSRYWYCLGIEVKKEAEYEKFDRRKLPGCCKSCFKGNLEGETLLRESTRKENGLDDRIRSIGFMKGHNAEVLWKQWVGDISEIDMDSLSDDKRVLVVIANLFDQKRVMNGGETGLSLSGKVKKLINDKHAYSKVPFNDLISLQDVIAITRVDKVEKTV